MEYLRAKKDSLRVSLEDFDLFLVFLGFFLPKFPHSLRSSMAGAGAGSGAGSGSGILISGSAGASTQKFPRPDG